MLLKVCTALFLSTVLLSAIEDMKLSSQIEYLDFSNSVQKEDGKRYSIAVTGKEDKHLFGVQYELTQTDTKQPPLDKDLEVDKYALQYTYLWDSTFRLQGRYLHIRDNIAPTDGGNIYGLGVNYASSQKDQYGLRIYMSDYADFNVYQSDFLASRKFRFHDLSVKLQAILKGIWLENKNSTGFTKNADNAYLTPGLKAHFAYHDYIGGIGAFFGKRVFGIMDDGRRVQHHAMEFDRTLMLGIGKRFDTATVMLKHNYMRATELPYENSDVTANSTMLYVEYSF